MTRPAPALLLAVATAAACALQAAAGPYPPAPGQPGSTALAADSRAFVAWAVTATNYVPGEECATDYQRPERALGPADAGGSNGVVCLGRGGVLTVGVGLPIADGPGPDFAVFENAVLPTFLELAFVEVSSDGTNFHRFPGVSLTPDPVNGHPAQPFGAIDPTDLDGFAGKYPAGYGTPLDLADLGAPAGLDTEQVRWVRLVDVVGDGSVDDALGSPVYDPYPTVGTAGFDLDAVGVIHFPMPVRIARVTDGVSVSWTAVSNRTYQLQGLDAGPGQEWEDIGPSIEGDDLPHSVVDTPGGSVVRSYRVVRSDWEGGP